ncbi:zinc finger protein 611-like [Diorhabda sublineata]|uniref:zinc finger protein 611-like n=1 Tax=Diorhabda sublineata TaxID=1163346 RepID=UPI0024E1863C|nr:zinc finger protein 611-like [Diorhabda sublineata]
MEQILVKEEIDIQNDLLWNIDIKQELNEEAPKTFFQNEMNNTDIKQELCDEVDTVIFQNVKIKQEIDEDINTVQILEESKFANGMKGYGSYRFDMHNIKRKFKRLLKNWKPWKVNTITGIMICGLCGCLYTKRIELLHHFFTNHCVKQKKLLNKKKFNQKNVSCKKEEQVIDLSVFRNLKDNVKIEIVEDDLKQDVSLNNYFNVERQELRKSNGNWCNYTEEKSLKCEICSKTILHKNSLDKHFSIHIGGKSIKCGVCSKTFSQKNQLNNHLLSHIGQKPFKCDICSKPFSRKDTLSHTGEKPFKCYICLKSFSQKIHLNRHSRSHTGLKPFKCDICLKTFSLKDSLDSHMRSYTGEKPFKCDICSKSFASKNNLKTHLRSHTGEKPFKCDVCLKTFSQKGNLNRHYHSHRGNKQLKCDLFGNVFT